MICQIVKIIIVKVAVIRTTVAANRSSEESWTNNLEEDKSHHILEEGDLEEGDIDEH